MGLSSLSGGTQGLKITIEIKGAGGGVLGLTDEASTILFVTKLTVSSVHGNESRIWHEK